MKIPDRLLTNVVLRAPNREPKTNKILGYDYAFGVRSRQLLAGPGETALLGGAVEQEDFAQVTRLKEAEGNNSQIQRAPSKDQVIMAAAYALAQQLNTEFMSLQPDGDNAVHLINMGQLYFIDEFSHGSWRTISFAYELARKVKFLRNSKKIESTLWLSELTLREKSFGSREGDPKIFGADLAIVRAGMSRFDEITIWRADRQQHPGGPEVPAAFTASPPTLANHSHQKVGR